MDTTDIRLFFVSGGVLGAAALLGLRWVSTVPGLYLFFAVFGMGFGLAGLVPASTLVTRWFDRRRPVALSIASTGLSVGGIVLTPVSAWLIDRRGLAGAGSTLAVLWVVGIIPLAVLLLRSRPSDLGLVPDGEPRSADSTTVAASSSDRSTAAETPVVASSPDRSSAAETPVAGPAPDAGATFAEARRTRYFIAMCIAYAAIFFGQVGAIAQLFKMVLERADVGTAGTSLSILAFASVVARLVGGALVLRLPTRAFTAALALTQAVGLVILAVVDTPTSLVAASAFLGVSIGNLLMLQPLLLAEAFGVRQYSRIYSFNQLFGTLGVAGGPLALGVIRDWSDYRTAFFVAAAASLTGFLGLVAAGSTDRVRAGWLVAGADADDTEPSIAPTS